MMASRASTIRSEKGASIVLLSLTMLLLIGAAALAVDLGVVRADIRADRLAADAASTAGAASIDPFAGNQADLACQVAWEYLLLNLEDEGPSTSSPACSTFASACDPAVVRQASATAGPYSVMITHPVPDGHTLLAGQTLNADIDGVACQRFAVSIARDREYRFARVLGFDSTAPWVDSVAKIGAGVGAGEVVPLLVLEPIACDALFTSGQGKLTVSYFMDSPGFIVVDSDGSKTGNPNRCASNTYTIDSQGTQNGWIRAIPTPSGIPSVILSYALSGDTGAVPSQSFDPADLISPVDPADITDPTEPPESHFRLYPKPLGVSRRITRAPIDWRYNCKVSYPGYPIDLADPGAGTIPIDPCPETPAPYIDQLVTGYGGTGNPGFVHRWTDFYPCAVNSGSWVDPTITPVSGNWWVDCPTFIINNDKSVIFDGGDVVFDGTIDIRSSASLIVNPSPSTADRVVYVRDGDLIKGAQSSITFRQTMVYLEDGILDMVGGAGGLTWTAPIAGNFEDLALWSESPLPHQIGGQSGNTLTGTFFTPLASPFSLTGQGGQFQTDAQFLTRRLEIKGQGEVKMHPDPDRQTLIPIREVRLIR